MRFFFLLVLLAGLALGVGYPWAISNFSGEEIGRLPVYSRAGGFQPVTVRLSPDQAPLRVFVDMNSMGSRTLSGQRTVLTLTATANGRTVLSSSLTFAHQEPRSDNPQTGGMIYRDEAGIIDPVENADYVFVVGPGDADGIEMRSAELILREGAGFTDARIMPIGYVLIAIGFIGFVLSFAGRRRNERTPSGPPPPKWGR
ncbi:MAG: hypothetical protein WBA44_11015 [Mesorhizobium sp.]